MVKRYSTYAIAILLLAAAQQIHAQNNTAEVFGGWSYAKANPESTIPRQGMNGWVASANGYLTHWFGVGAEFAGQFGSIPSPSGITAPSLDFKEYSYVAGPQFRFLNQKKVQSSFKLMVGGVFGQVNIPASATPAQVSQLGSAGYLGFNQTKFAALFAVPVDVSVNRLIGIRVEPGLYLTNFNQSGQGNFRISIGPVFRFGGHD
ncbi:MAG TPA: hypothetical protein VML19_16855 [Verrucomicrobiae bacterium]|nr:hypothetical protein [Verrucomicrobiae bacterium]